MLVIFFGLFYGSRTAMIMTLVSLGVVELFVIAKLIILRGSYIIPGTILGLFFIAYFMMIFTLIRFYQKRDNDQYGLFKEYYGDATKKYEVLEREDRSLREENARLDGELDETISFYENIKNITAMLDFTRKLELMAGFIRSLADFSEGKLILVETRDGAAHPGKVFNISRSEGSQSKVVYETDGAAYTELFHKLLGEFSRGFAALYAELSRKSEYRHLVKGEFGTIGAIPLNAESDLMGIILVFDADRHGFEKIQTLGPLLAMELKKIRLYERVKELSIIDGLTGLYLRRHFLDILGSEVERALRTGIPLSFLIVDIDHFKGFNDGYGHLAGDVLLRDVAAIIRTEARSVDLIGRYGGDEIAVALPRADVAVAAAVAERMRAAVKALAVKLADDEVKVTLSIGVSSFPLHCGTTAELIDRADQALYQAKERGRDRVVVFGG